MPTVPELADRGIVALINHIKRNGAKPMTYSTFSELIGWFDKNGKPANRLGRVLGNIGNNLLNHDKYAPKITVLIHNDKQRHASSGFEEFVSRWPRMSESEKEQYTAQEKEKIEKYRRSGKFDEFLRSQQNKTSTFIEFSSQQEDGEFSVADGVSLKRHRASEYKYRVRNQEIVRRKKEESDYTCECCCFRFHETYGPLGKSYIECHHVKPLADSKNGGRIGLKDLAALCANCHRMIHKLLSEEKGTYKNNYPQSIKDLRRRVSTHRR